MAGVNRDAMEDLEDGEISGSDSDLEMGATTGNQAQVSDAVFNQSFQSRAPPQTTPSATSYRSCVRADSSDSNSDSDEDAAIWKRKRQKCSNVAPTAVTARLGGFHTMASQPSKKVNNIWGAVVQEQSQEAVAAELGILGMEGDISMSSRQSETYNYVLAQKMMKKEQEQGMEMLDSQLEEYMQHRTAEDGSDGHLKRKRPAKDRLGPRAEMDFKGRYEITEDDPDEKVIEEIAHRLMEPKKDLMERVVRVIGKKKAIELLYETATVEQNGGLYTVDGSRRRTPGGVYLNLLKNTPSISQEQVKEIFYDENQKEYNNKKAAKKRRRHLVAKKMKQAIGALDLQEHDDVSRETFASDTNEALESLEEVADGQSDAALGTEDTPVVYNSNDLEVF
ncbi:phosphorylated adapter RNA export protein isoform X2 [Chanos chanos]|uniref:Phosphorylated adapter RNA export protein n=1 Tax=Chanos chanos TaxID=29144 RepID=A0A6J2V0A6_CHACN|nr:phosphorylated adapter RNA export protein isoform X2 [Chanos chanos]